MDRCQRGSDKWEACGDLVPDLKVQVTGLTEGQWYAYRVRALNRLGASAPCKATDEIQAVDPKGNTESRTGGTSTFSLEDSGSQNIQSISGTQHRATAAVSRDQL